MSLHVYSDESGFPDHALQTIGYIWGNQPSCNELRTSVLSLMEKYEARDLKRSKIRAKKKLFYCAQDILYCVDQWRNTLQQCGISVYAGADVSVLYQLFFDTMTKKGYASFTFHPDKNLTLQRHTPHHIFTHDPRFTGVAPVLLRDEPLLLVADLLAGMYREAYERPECFKKNPETISYLPDVYKVRLWQRRKELEDQRKEKISVFNG